MRLVGATVVAVLAVAVIPALAHGHDPFGRAQATIGVSVVGSGNSQRVTVTVVDLDSLAPIPKVVVSASARRFGTTARRVLPVVKLSQVRYTVRLRALPRGRWRISLKAAGAQVIPTQLAVDVVRG